MFVMERELTKSVEGAKKIFATENAKGVEHFKKFEVTIEGLAKNLTRAHDRIDTWAIDNQVLRKRVSKLEARCDTLTGQVGVLFVD